MLVSFDCYQGKYFVRNIHECARGLFLCGRGGFKNMMLCFIKKKEEWVYRF